MTVRSNIKDSYRSAVEGLKQERDELNVKMHLAEMEVRDEWQEVEKKWEHFQTKAHELGKASGESAHELGEAFAILGEELKETYRRLKRAL